MVLTKKEIHNLQCSLGLSNKEINIIDNYVAKQIELEDMDKDIALIEILGIKDYYTYKTYEDQADDPVRSACSSAQGPLFS